MTAVTLLAVENGWIGWATLVALAVAVAANLYLIGRRL